MRRRTVAAGRREHRHRWVDGEQHAQLDEQQHQQHTSATSSSSTTTSSSSGGTDASTGLACGKSTCESLDALGAITLEPCCPTDANTCGLDLTPVAQFLPFPAMCMELMRPGRDNACPSKTIMIQGNPFVLPGCCAAATNVCGAVADFSSTAPGLNFGCADTSGFADAGPAPQRRRDEHRDRRGLDAAADGG